MAGLVRHCLISLNSFLGIVFLILQIDRTEAFATEFDEAVGRMQKIKSEGRKVSDAELTELLALIAKSENIPEENKQKEMQSLLETAYVLHGRDGRNEPISVDGLLIEAIIKRRSRYIEAHPEMSAKEKEAVREGRFFVGMTTDQVKGSWGLPGRVQKSSNVTREVEKWSYFDSVFLRFENQKLVEWTTPE